VADNTIRRIYSIESQGANSVAADLKTVAQADRGFRQEIELTAEQVALRNRLLKEAIPLDALNALKTIEGLERDLTKALKDSIITVDEYTRAYDRLGKARSETATRQTSLRGLDGDIRRDVDDFLKASNSVQLAGAFQTNLGALSALGGLGGSSVGSNIAVAGEFVALVEELPRLKIALRGLPNTIAAAVSALGVGGLAATGGLLAGLAALAVVFNLVQKEVNQLREAERIRLDGIRDLEDIIASGGGSEVVREQLALFEQQATASTASLDRAKAERDLIRGLLREFELTGSQDTIRELDEMGLVADRWFRVLAPAKARLSELNEEVSGLESESSGTSASIEDFNDALSDSRIIANDAALAEKARQQEASAAAVRRAALDGELLTTRLRLTNATQEQINAEADTLRIRQRAVRAEIDSLRRSGVQSEEVTERLAALREELATLGLMLQTVTSVVAESNQENAESVLAAATQAAELEGVRQNLKGATSEQIKAEREGVQSRIAVVQAELASLRASGSTAEEVSGRIEALNQQLETLNKTLDIIDATPATGDIERQKREAEEYAKAIAGINRDVQDSLEDIAIDRANRLTDLGIERQRDELDARREFNRAIAKINRDGAKREIDAVRQQNFKALAEGREQRKKDVAEAREQNEIERRERQIDFNRALEDLKRENERERQEIEINRRRALRDLNESNQQRLDIETTYFQTSIRLHRDGYDTMLSETRRFFSQLTGIVSGAQGDALLNAIGSY